MQLAMLGLGRMGGNMVQRLLQAGHKVVAYDVDPRRAAELAAIGAAPATTLDEVIAWTAATPTTRTRSGGRRSWPSEASTSATRASAAVSGG